MPSCPVSPADMIALTNQSRSGPGSHQTQDAGNTVLRAAVIGGMISLHDQTIIPESI